MTHLRPIVAGIFVCVVMSFLSAPIALAQNADPTAQLELNVGASDPVIGQANMQIPFEVPEYYGIEPTLVLHYNPNGGDGMFGVGWQLAGFSSIQRAGRHGHGAPQYNRGRDTYTLDGQELVEDTSLGGTHSTKIQSFQRIRYDAAKDEWHVWNQDGGHTTYTPVFRVHVWIDGGWQQYTFRWGVSAVTDPMGHTVNYAWECEGSPTLECYPSQITYRDTVRIEFERGQPPQVDVDAGTDPDYDATTDAVSFATGGKILGRTTKRILSVTVSEHVNEQPQRIRKYAIGYQRSLSSHRWMIHTIQQAGKDDSAKLPPLTFDLPKETRPVNPVSVMTTEKRGPRFRVGDFNGDGKQDLLRFHRPSGKVEVLLSGEQKRRLWATVGTSGNPRIVISEKTGKLHFWIGDVNGDGADDLITLEHQGAPTFLVLKVRLAGKNEAGIYEFGDAVKTPYSANRDFTIQVLRLGEVLTVGDFNGDGHADLILVSRAKRYWPLRVYFGSESGTFDLQPQTWGHVDVNRGAVSPQIGDFDGDGRSDFLVGGRLYRSTGASFEQIGEPGFKNGFLLGDFNGDGKTDVLDVEWKIKRCKRSWDCSQKGEYVADGFTIYYSRGRGGTQTGPPVGIFVDTHTLSTLRTGDFNGDGRTDFMYVLGESHYVVLSRGYGFAPAKKWLTAPANSSLSLTLDYNGDGKTDFLSASGPTNVGALNTYEVGIGPVPVHARRGPGGVLPASARKSTTRTTKTWPWRSMSTACICSTGKRSNPCCGTEERHV